MKTGYSFGSLVSFTEALNAAAVKITGDQTIGGVKTFTSNPISSAAQGMGGSHLTRKDYVDGALALKAPLSSPALTGTPTAPTAAVGTDTTQIATTAFVQTAKEAARTTTYTIAGEAAMLALVKAKKGDLAIRSDLNNRTFILYAEPYSTLSNWRVLAENVVISDFAKTLLDDVDAPAMHNTLGIAELEPRISNNESKVFEALRRSYADAGLNLVEGSFEEGGKLLVASDVMITASGDGYSWGGSEFPHTVAAGSTPTPLGSGGWIDRTDVMLRGELAGGGGSDLIHMGSGSLTDAVGYIRPLSYYGNTRDGLVLLLNYAKSTGLPIKLTSDIVIQTEVDVDFAGAVLNLDFSGNKIVSDSMSLTLRNLGANSKIVDPNFKNVTAPWTITRWDSNGNWASPSGSLAQSNADGRYMPTSNDYDIWSTLTTAQQNQSISCGMTIYTSTGVDVVRPKGRFVLYDFADCNYCRVIQPDITAGGKGAFGTVLFHNLSSTAYGVGNFVIGGTVRYGSHSGVCFMRNKFGGVVGDFTPFRVGESGVKTYQGEVGGRSARCYEMLFDSIFPHQAVFDGVDLCSDYGGTPLERTDDYTLAQYAWHELPTKHTVKNIISYGCRGAGIWGDGRVNEYQNIRAEMCVRSGVVNIGKYQYFNGITAVNCNLANALTGQHQIDIPFSNSICGVRVICEANTNITHGYSLYAPNSYVSDVDVSLVDDTNVRSVFALGDVLSARSTSVGDGGDTVHIGLRTRHGQLRNPTGYVGSTATYGMPGAEGGDAFLVGVAGGVQVKGVRASGSFGGMGIVAVGESNAYAGGNLANGEAGLFYDGTNLNIVYKKPDGSVSLYTM